MFGWGHLEMGTQSTSFILRNEEVSLPFPSPNTRALHMLNDAEQHNASVPCHGIHLDVLRGGTGDGLIQNQMALRALEFPCP